ncbi:hypothetical protein GCM10011333_22320 [Sediminivirga luteola]|uniref:Uncharacterized protein n=2 Tax=Sediminivirga luteola TaxID=1774748 RepID=A0A8J2TYX4_9MICO|nr:hypothetical protein GCM10011333_22320 [Sediminivirga luteola]
MHSSEAEGLGVEIERLRRRVLGLSYAQLDAGSSPGHSRRALIRSALSDLAGLSWQASALPGPCPAVPDHGDAALGYQLTALLQDCLAAGGDTEHAAWQRAVRLRRAL